MTVTLFHGYLGWAAGLLLILGFAAAWEFIEGLVTERYTVGFPRLLTRRWDCPRARVTLPDGRCGRVIDVHCGGGAGDMVTVRTYDDAGREHSEWVPARHLAPQAATETREIAS